MTRFDLDSRKPYAILEGVSSLAFLASSEEGLLRQRKRRAIDDFTKAVKSG